MAINIDDLINEVRQSRRYFLSHLRGLSEEQWDWKPYPECKSVRETLQHLVSDDLAALKVLQTGSFLGDSSLNVTEEDATKLLALLEDSHEALCAYLKETFDDAPLDKRVSFWFGETKLALAMVAITGEDYYHAGQVAFTRLATDPTWDYYAEIHDMQVS